MKKILILDNYDSFTYNLVHLVEKLFKGAIDTVRNDKILLEKVKEYDKILLSPGPGIPLEAGLMPEIVKEYAAQKSILGVCLGHQCIAEVFGGKLLNLKVPIHGKSTAIEIKNSGDYLFRAIPERIQAGRYHSWVADKKHFPDTLEITAVDENSEIMALAHKKFDVKGVQFHPESIMTEYGAQMLKNWLEH